MKRIYTYKFRIYPNTEQRNYLSNVFGCCRFVYNYFLNEKKKQYEETKRSDSYNEQSRKLTLLRKTKGFEFLNKIPLQTLQCSLRNMHTAYDNFYKHKSSYPKFKNKKNKQSFKISQENRFKIKDNKLYIPKLKSGIDIIIEREIVGKICFSTISKTKSDRYYISITVKQDYEPYEKTNKSVGLDLGIKDFVITSDGLKYKSKRNEIKSLKRKLKHNQRHLSRKVYGSKRYEKQVLKCNKIYQKITDIKTDYIHKITTELVKNFDEIKIEDLNIKFMMKNHKLAEAISECNWCQFISTLKYKCNWNDKKLIKVNRFYPSSQMCSECGYVEKKIKNLNVREWTCCNCGVHHDRDVNAAKNILNYNSARNVEYSRRVVDKQNRKPMINSDCLATMKR